jgi:1,4-alpha-glucan branching enzyme
MIDTSTPFGKATQFLTDHPLAQNRLIKEELKALKYKREELDPQGPYYNTLSDINRGDLAQQIDKIILAANSKLHPLSEQEKYEKKQEEERAALGGLKQKLPHLPTAKFHKEFKKIDLELQSKILAFIWIFKGCPKEDNYGEKKLRENKEVLNEGDYSKLGNGDGTILEQFEAEHSFHYKLTEAKKNNGNWQGMVNSKVQFFQSAVNGSWFTPIQLQGIFNMMHPLVQQGLRDLGIRPPLFGQSASTLIGILPPDQFLGQLDKFAPAVRTKLYELVWVASGCPKQINFSQDLLAKDTSILRRSFPPLLGGTILSGTIFEQLEAELFLDDQLTEAVENKWDTTPLAQRKVEFLQRCLADVEGRTHSQMKACFRLMHPAVQAQLKREGIQPPFYGRGFRTNLHKTLGAHYNAQTGRTTFRVYAPNATKVVLNLTAFKRLEHILPLIKGADGVWTVETDQAAPGRSYHFMVTGQNSPVPVKKVDPFAFQNCIHCATLGKDDHESIVADIHKDFTWTDQAWMAQPKCDPAHQPLNIYEIHSPTWQVDANGKALNWRELAPRLAQYCHTQGQNAVELMGVFAHPQAISMGYQITNYFAPNSNMGSWEDFKCFVNEMHRQNIRVFVDWVPAHFALNEFGLINFDGTPMLESDDPAIAKHPAWGTIVFDFSKQFTKDFLASNVDFLLNELHIDGLRVDAVTAMLYLNEGREDQITDGTYKKRFHRKGSEIDADVKSFFKNMLTYTHKRYPKALMMAEESKQQFNLTQSGGLGFDLAWHMGLMNDTFKYWKMPFSKEGRQQSFSLLTHTVEKVDGQHRSRGTIVNAYSHDECSNGKGTFWGQMAGNTRPDKYANGRLALAYQLLRGGGASLSFMGNEILQTREWHGFIELMTQGKEKERSTVMWEELDRNVDKTEHQYHTGAQKACADLNKLFLKSPGLHDQTSHGISWINASDSNNCVVSFHRTSQDGEQQFACIFNTSDRDIRDYKVALPGESYAPKLGKLKDLIEIYNTDHREYGGQGRTNANIKVHRDPSTKRPTHLELRLPPYTAIVLEEHFHA